MADDMLQRWLGVPEAREVGAEALYQLLWVGSFHPPVFARVYRADRAIVGVGARGTVEQRGFPSAFAWLEAVFAAEPQRTRRELDIQGWEAVESRVELAGFWELSPRSDEVGLDGAEWTITGICDGRHHEVCCWSPESQHLRELAIGLVVAAGMDDVELY